MKKNRLFRLLAMILTAIMMISMLSACGSSSDNDDDDDDDDVSGITVSSPSTIEGAIDAYFDVYVRGKLDKLEVLAPKEYWEKELKNENNKNISVKEIIKKLKENNVADTWIEDLEEEYGKNIEVSFKIVEKDEMKKSDFNDLKDYLNERYDIPKKNIENAYEVELEITYKGKDDKDTDDAEFTVVQIDGKWYVVSNNSFIGAYLAVFYYQSIKLEEEAKKAEKEAVEDQD